MLEELPIELKRTRLLALESNLDDVHRALVRSARIPTEFAAELRGLLAAVADLEHRVTARAGS